ncbi:MAG: hypothetical protein ABMA13_23240, partial [Chthoniobacteraceae bacterium]
NRYYKSNEEFMLAVGDAMREEYQAIIAAGFFLKIGADFSRVWLAAWLLTGATALVAGRFVLAACVSGSCVGADHAVREQARARNAVASLVMRRGH